LYDVVELDPLDIGNTSPYSKVKASAAGKARESGEGSGSSPDVSKFCGFST
jgi:hypothetical protein